MFILYGRSWDGLLDYMGLWARAFEEFLNFGNISGI